jgi:hypothetical protein
MLEIQNPTGIFYMHLSVDSRILFHKKCYYHLKNLKKIKRNPNPRKSGNVVVFGNHLGMPLIAAFPMGFQFYIHVPGPVDLGPKDEGASALPCDRLSLQSNAFLKPYLRTDVVTLRHQR